ncbi:MAG TPA: nuclear transport factor 2 family protein [Ignavibacteria bacterium]|nr:nuclear transport factor 2 family protein [Ignavibacteria bacterium]
MKPTNSEIAEAFSFGNFSITYPYLADDVKWIIIGDKILHGKENVRGYCDKTAEYFKTVKTEFRQINIIIDKDIIAVNGTARFIHNENKVTEISSCDIYIFKDQKLHEITSYCIVTSDKN